MKTTYSWIARLYVSASVLVTGLIAAFDPDSQHREVLLSSGELPGSVALALLIAVALAGIIDVAVNDWLPPQFDLPWTHRHRHVVYMVLAVGQVGLVFALVHGGDVRPVVARYALDAAMAVLIAGYGILDHYRCRGKA
ncbi:MAG: hypothetical protein Q8N13_11225 [Acidovorax sp.]|nr:hypothetical protein [Acidovorax sp.]